jgi:hypothetical protein
MMRGISLAVLGSVLGTHALNPLSVVTSDNTQLASVAGHVWNLDPSDGGILGHARLRKSGKCYWLSMPSTQSILDAPTPGHKYVFNWGFMSEPQLWEVSGNDTIACSRFAPIPATLGLWSLHAGKQGLISVSSQSPDFTQTSYNVSVGIVKVVANETATFEAKLLLGKQKCDESGDSVLSEDGLLYLLLLCDNMDDNNWDYEVWTVDTHAWTVVKKSVDVTGFAHTNIGFELGTSQALALHQNTLYTVMLCYELPPKHGNPNLKVLSNFTWLALDPATGVGTPLGLFPMSKDRHLVGFTVDLSAQPATMFVGHATWSAETPTSLASAFSGVPLVDEDGQRGESWAPMWEKEWQSAVPLDFEDIIGFGF